MTVWIPRTLRSARRLVRSPAARANALHEWQRLLTGEPALPGPPIRSILVLCHGNICRSPFAEALILRRQPDLVVSSAGLEAGAGAPAEPAALRVAREFGVDLSAHRSRALDPAALAAADLVLVMEAAQGVALRTHGPAVAGRTRLLGDFLDARPFHIADPWGHAEAVFVSTFARIASAVERLGERLEAATR